MQLKHGYASVVPVEVPGAWGASFFLDDDGTLRGYPEKQHGVGAVAPVLVHVAEAWPGIVDALQETAAMIESNEPTHVTIMTDPVNVQALYSDRRYLLAAWLPTHEETTHVHSDENQTSQPER